MYNTPNQQFHAGKATKRRILLIPHPVLATSCTKRGLTTHAKSVFRKFRNHASGFDRNGGLPTVPLDYRKVRTASHPILLHGFAVEAMQRGPLFRVRRPLEFPRGGDSIGTNTPTSPQPD
jgi:hypothetical protein